LDENICRAGIHTNEIILGIIIVFTLLLCLAAPFICMDDQWPSQENEKHLQFAHLQQVATSSTPLYLPLSVYSPKFFIFVCLCKNCKLPFQLFTNILHTYIGNSIDTLYTRRLRGPHVILC